MHVLVQLGLDVQLRVLGLHALQLDGHLLVRDRVLAQVDVAERAAADLPPEPKTSSDPQFHHP